MYLFLSRSGDKAEIQVRFPADPDTVWHEITRLDEYSNSPEPVVITGIDCEVRNLVKYIECADLDDAADIKKLNELVRHLEEFGQEEKQILPGVLHMAHANSLDDVLQAVGSVKSYELIPDTVSPESLGRWVVEQNRQEFPESVRPYLNYAIIGTEYFDQHNGVFTPDGYVKRKENAQMLAAENKPAFALTLASFAGTYHLDLPATASGLEQAMLTLKMSDLGHARIDSVEIDHPWAHLLPKDGIHVNDANTLAQCVSTMSETELRTFGAALEAEEPGTFSDAVAIAVDLEDYELVDDNEAAYGYAALRKAGANDEVLELLEDCLDFEKLGRMQMDADGLRTTSYGMVRCPDTSGHRQEPGCGLEMGGMNL